MKKQKEKRPNCPHCGAPDPISNGTTRWLCRCGRQWMKVKVIKESNPKAYISIQELCKAPILKI